jgi:hypothetical protein
MNSFKVDDWVRYTMADNTKAVGQVLSIDDNFMHIGIDDTIYYRFDLERPINAELWKPVAEWCWNIPTKSLGVVSRLAVDSLGNEQYRFESNMNGISSKGYYNLDELQPFTGDIPSWIKEI